MALGRSTYYLRVALFLFALARMDIHAQTSPFDPVMSEQAALIQERVDGFTDRSIYISGEAIRFRAQVQISGIPDGGEWSKILYVELHSASGLIQAQGKFRIQRNMASGELLIPEGIYTGNYFLRFYTRWMRNWDPSIYSHIPLRIINPHTTELAENGPGGTGELMRDPPSGSELKLSFTMQSSPFRRGDTIRVSLGHQGEDTGERAAGCISVVPAAAQGRETMQPLSPQAREGNNFHLSFLPDLHGLTLSGRVMKGEMDDQIPEDARVHFTLLGRQATYSLARSDAYGNFALILPWREGRMEFLIQPEQPGEEVMKVRIDQDFDPRVLTLEAPDFELDQEERELLALMARNMQLSEIFRDASHQKDGAEAGDAAPFYGSPDFTLDLDEYVLLPTLEEVFINLVPGVTPLMRRKRTELQIASVNPGIILFPPLLMIDQVPVFDMEQFLSVPPAKISHIDVVSDVYLKGDMRFGGIINLRSREGNMAGIDLPEHSFFIDLEGLYPQPDQRLEKTSPGDQLPDTRNTLLWIPDLQLDGSVSVPISFLAPDYPGEYAVSFRGWDEQGQLVSAEAIISIK